MCSNDMPLGPEQNDDVNGPSQNEGAGFVKKNLYVVFSKLAFNYTKSSILTHPLICFFILITIHNLQIRENIATGLHNSTYNLFLVKYSRAMNDENLNLVEEQKKLGLHIKTANPLTSIVAGFLEPIMNMMNIYVFAVRELFFISTWRDPYLSAWTLVGLCFLMVVLAFFPYRLFFFIVGILCFGPQVRHLTVLFRLLHSMMMIMTNIQSKHIFNIPISSSRTTSCSNRS